MWIHWKERRLNWECHWGFSAQNNWLGKHFFLAASPKGTLEVSYQCCGSSGPGYVISWYQSFKVSFLSYQFGTCKTWVVRPCRLEPRFQKASGFRKGFPGSESLQGGPGRPLHEIWKWSPHFKETSGCWRREDYPPRKAARVKPSHWICLLQAAELEGWALG